MRRPFSMSRRLRRRQILPSASSSSSWAAELGEQTGGGRKVLFDASDVRVRRVVGDLVVDVDLVHDRGAELGLVLGHEQDARSRRWPGPTTRS